MPASASPASAPSAGPAGAGGGAAGPAPDAVDRKSILAVERKKKRMMAEPADERLESEADVAGASAPPKAS
jgi:hypothetical protein